MGGLFLFFYIFYAGIFLRVVKRNSFVKAKDEQD